MSFRQLIVFLGIFVLLFLRTVIVPDSDFGWQIRIGAYILNHGIPATDPLTYAMPSYPFINHEWLSSVLWSSMYSVWGAVPLFVLYTGLAVGSLLVLFFASKKQWTFLPIFAGGAAFFDFMGVRAQIVTWFFFAILLCVLFQKQIWKRWRFALPVLFLFWANLHGGFGIGLVMLTVVLIGKMVKERKVWREALVLLALCFGATLINPYGIKLWWEVWVTLSDASLRWSINEWYPAIYYFNLSFWAYGLLSVVLVLRYWKRYPLTELFLYFLLLLSGMLSMRNIPLWVLFSFFITTQSFSFLYQEISRYKYGARRFKISYFTFSGIVVGVFLLQLGSFLYGRLILKANPNPYPVKAVVYLQHHLPRQNIFSSYGWGGYLDWQLPEKKVFIDGSMTTWRWHADLPGKSNYALQEYKKVLAGKIPFASFAEKYHISTILVPQVSIIKPPTNIFGIPLKNHSILAKLFTSQKSFYAVVVQVQKLGWKEVYHDTNAIIYQRPGGNP